jgi:uncharacterized protein HemX
LVTYAPIISECQFQKYIHIIDVDTTNPPLKPIDSLSVKMKIKNLALIALISMIIYGIGVLGFLEIRNMPMISRDSHQHQIPEPDSEQSASVSKSTTLLLLAVGVIGALSVRRKKKNKRSPTQKNEPQTTSEDRNKAFVKLNKQYLNMQYKITQHKFSGENPPDCLLKEISDLERKVRLISRALE